MCTPIKNNKTNNDKEVLNLNYLVEGKNISLEKEFQMFLDYKMEKINELYDSLSVRKLDIQPSPKPEVIVKTYNTEVLEQTTSNE